LELYPILNAYWFIFWLGVALEIKGLVIYARVFPEARSPKLEELLIVCLSIP
jgi:hypothetical protein